jgi:alpha-L-arabinofuranosidase
MYCHISRRKNRLSTQNQYRIPPFRSLIMGVFMILLTSFIAHPSSAQSSHAMTLNVDQAEITINKHIYGHFAEHLGRGIYDGIWYQDESGEYSIRQDIVDALRAIQIPNLRWPGGCFADYYFWKDGVGPRDERPSIVNVLWGGVTEDNSVGTHEFMELIDLLDTEPIVVGNVGSGTVQDMAQWWEYVNHPGPSPMADWRKENGREEPWNIVYWGVGNESWGCGGHMRPEFYADLYRQFQTYLHAYPGIRPFRIAAGVAGGNYEWTEVLMREAGDYMEGLDLHHYTILGDWVTSKGHATEYGEAEWFELMKRGWQTEELVEGHSAIMDKYDPEKRVWLIVGEWGTWHEPLEGSPAGFLHQQQTIRDALVASQSLNIFNQNADRVQMANIAQTVNVLQAMILTEGKQMILTPTYHVFEFYNVHHDALLIPMDLDQGTYEFNGESIRPLTATASRPSADSDVINITISNLDPTAGRTVETAINGFNASSVSGRILTADDMTAHNTFENPNVVAPAPFDGARISDGKLVIDLPPMSLVVLEVR